MEPKIQHKKFTFNPIYNSNSTMTCTACGESIFDLNERKKGLDFDIHRVCFICSLETCKKILSSRDYVSKDSLCYCSSHFLLSKDLTISKK
eukprot:gene1300-11384_t